MLARGAGHVVCIGSDAIGRAHAGLGAYGGADPVPGLAAGRPDQRRLHSDREPLLERYAAALQWAASSLENTWMDEEAGLDASLVQ
ncbi:short-chain dehydrogenase [Bordetella pertussis]|nr:short-chain dehydrogenase [Bordetella pertussis]